MQYVTREHTKGQLGRKEKAAFSIKYLFLSPHLGERASKTFFFSELATHQFFMQPRIFGLKVCGI